jgi:hypothetical protein
MLPTFAQRPVLPASSYRLCEHVYWCERNSRVILLDLRTDLYLALDSRASSFFPKLVQGEVPTAALQAVWGAQVNELAEALLDRGLLTTEPGRGKDGGPVAVPPPSFEVTADSLDGRVWLRSRDVTAFWVSIARTGIHLRVLPLFYVVTAARTRRAQRAAYPLRNGRRPYDLATRVAVFDRLRPLAFTARDACLFESLAMIEFLALFDLHASWVFGVQTAPFCSHCWVQLGDTVINDTVEHIRGFTPIMAI